MLAATYANMGTAYRILGEDEKAGESYDEALRLNSGQANAYLGRGQLLERQEKINEALENYSRSVELRPTEKGFLLLGHALERTGKSTEALNCLPAGAGTLAGLN